MMIKCNCCGKEVDTEKKRQDGLPPMTGFITNDATYNICADCMMDEARLTDFIVSINGDD